MVLFCVDVGSVKHYVGPGVVCRRVQSRRLFEVIEVKHFDIRCKFAIKTEKVKSQTRTKSSHGAVTDTTPGKGKLHFKQWRNP